MADDDRFMALVEEWSSTANSRPSVASSTLAELREDLEGYARAAVAVADLPVGAEPIRLTKARVRQMLDCERHMLAMLLPRDSEVTPALALGSLLDVLVAHFVTTGRLDDDPLALAIDLLTAQEDGQNRVIEWVNQLDPSLRSAFEEDLAARRSSLVGAWTPLPAALCPRTQDRALLVLADGEVLVDGRADLILGGPPSERPAAIIETKSGTMRREDLEDALLYGLLVALRDDRAPACVITCCAAPYTADITWIGEDELRSAALRLEVALEVAGELAHGRPPTETPGFRCGWCPDASVCPSRIAVDNPDGTVDADEDEDDDTPF